MRISCAASQNTFNSSGNTGEIKPGHTINILIQKRRDVFFYNVGAR